MKYRCRGQSEDKLLVCLRPLMHQLWAKPCYLISNGLVPKVVGSLSTLQAETHRRLGASGPLLGLQNGFR